MTCIASESGGAVHALSTAASGSTILGTAYGQGGLTPLVGGSGGGGSDAGGGPNAIHQSGGGGGGGAILISSDTSITVSGTIDARGGDAPTTGSRACKSPGSGGAIRLVAPVVNITGTLDVRGGTFGDGTAETGSPGRVRIDTLNPASVNLLGIRPSLAELGNDPARVDATRSVGTNLVAFPDVLPELTITHFRGVPLPRGPATTLPIYVEATGTSEQLITLSAAGLGQANVIIAITPRHGPRILSSPIALDTTSGPVTWSGPVTLPGNVDARIDVWVTP